MERPTTGAGEELLLCFRLGQEEYGIDILAVREIRELERPARIANSPPFALGVIMLRGDVVPLLDLRIKYGLPVEAAQPAVVIAREGDGVVGLVVDAVTEVLAVAREAVRPPPRTGARAGPGFIRGIATVEGRTLFIADLRALVAGAQPPTEAMA